ncbi:toprim domain-containing protein, partial [Myxococcota bacterium]
MGIHNIPANRKPRTTLVIVESPNKVRKIQSILGAGYDVVATLGHFRDLPGKELGIDLGTMEPKYVAIRGKTGVQKRLRSRAKHADEVILATDPDREGEGIAWHAAQTLGAKGRRARRARFQEITKAALQTAIETAGQLDLNLVGAQQARRIVDRLCGYQVSPLLWPFGRGLSAGRVQSATPSRRPARARPARLRHSHLLAGDRHLRQRPRSGARSARQRRQ